MEKGLLQQAALLSKLKISAPQTQSVQTDDANLHWPSEEEKQKKSNGHKPQEMAKFAYKVGTIQDNAQR